jgi:hypothetical protein
MSDDEQFFPELDDTAMSMAAWEEEPEDEGWLDADQEPVVDDLRSGETLEERDARLLQRNADEREEDRPEGTEYNPLPDHLASLGFGRSDRPTRANIRGNAVKVITAEGAESWRDLGTDEDAVRIFIEAHASESGLSMEDLRRRFRPGKPRTRERYRRRQLAEIVQAAVAAGAQQTMIGEVLGLAPPRVSELANDSG